MTRTRRRTTTAATTPTPTACRCPEGKPTLIGAFRDQTLVSLRRQHLPARCGMVSEILDPTTFVRTAR